MRHLRSLKHPLTTTFAVALLVIAMGCSKSNDTGVAGKPPAVTSQVSSSPQAKPASKLGSLTAFRDVAVEVNALVNKGDLTAAKARIKDLEIGWDAAEAGLKPRAADDWHMLDKSIDHALSALRANAPNQNDCKKAMDDLLRTFDFLQPQR